MTRVAIVGGGIVGCSCAYYLAREGVEVTLLEQHEVAYGASGRNPGFVWLHGRNPGFALDVSLAGRALYDTLAEELPLPFEFRPSGGVMSVAEFSVRQREASAFGASGVPAGRERHPCRARG